MTKYDGCEVVRTIRQGMCAIRVYDVVRAADGTVVLEKYVGEVLPNLLTDEAVATLKQATTEFRLVGQLSLEPIAAVTV